jgi:CRP-like cAMP-binding protein
MAKHLYHDHLKSVPLFKGLDAKELDEIAVSATELDYRPGRVLMTEGEFAHEMFVVIDGTLEVTRGGTHVADIGPGGFAGEMALLNHSRRNSTVTAKTDAHVVHIDGRAFNTLLRDIPQIAVKMLPIIAGRVCEFSDNHTN